MRLTADVSSNPMGIQRLMIYEAADSVYLFGFDKAADGRDLFDDWYETLADVKSAASEAYKVAPDAWTRIADPLEYCQHDWVQPVRVKGRGIGEPEWGTLERLVNGRWEIFEE